jgi:hypothetical protein
MTGLSARSLALRSSCSQSPPRHAGGRLPGEGRGIGKGLAGSGIEGLEGDREVKPLHDVRRRIVPSANDGDRLVIFFCEPRHFRWGFAKKRLAVQRALAGDDKVRCRDPLLQIQRLRNDGETGLQLRMAEGCQPVTESARRPAPARWRWSTPI